MLHRAASRLVRRHVTPSRALARFTVATGRLHARLLPHATPTLLSTLTPSRGITSAPKGLTRTTSELLSSSLQFAAAQGHKECTPLHVLATLCEHSGASGSSNGYLRQLLERSAASVAQLAKTVSARLAGLPVLSPKQSSSDMSPALTALLQRAVQVAGEQGDGYVALDHLITAAVGDAGLAAVWTEAGVDRSKLLAVMRDLRGGRTVDSPEDEASGRTSALSKYGHDLVALAEAGKLDPVIGREDEVRRVIQVLSRRTKCNPVLVGPPGVGKTAIVEGLAQRIHARDVPGIIADQRVWSLDVGSLIAGAKHQGEFEERLKSVLEEVKASSGRIILFVDEVHLLIGAGAAAGGINAANLLKPVLARGEVRMVGATTSDEYRKYIETDEAFTRRMQPVYVDEPDLPSTISILRGLKRKYEAHHGVRLLDASLVHAARLAKRYITQRRLPDSAIDLCDEACSHIRVQLDSKPEAIDKLERRQLQLKIEATALEAEKDAMSKVRLEKVKEELATLREKLHVLMMKHDAEKARVKQQTDLKKRLDELQHQLEKAHAELDLEKAARLQYGEIPSLQRELEAAEAAAAVAVGGEARMVSDSVTPDDISDVVSRWTGIPVSRLTSTDKERLLRLEERLNGRVLGQRVAVHAVAEAIVRARGGLAAPGRPASFLLLGPTGTGKTELCRALARELFDDEKHMVRIDCSEFTEPHTVSRLIGAPPGYVGYDQAGQLTEAVRSRPFQLVLFDEVEKAHKQVLTVLLQLLDDGRVTDSHGRVIDFSNTIVILTSNLGAQYLLDAAGASRSITVDDLVRDAQALGASSSTGAASTSAAPAPTCTDASGIRSDVQESVMHAVRAHFLPEFLNRLDEIVTFAPLSRSSMHGIVRSMIADVSKRLDERGIELKVADDAVQRVIADASDPAYGARPMRRFVDKYIATELSRMIVAGVLPDHSIVHVAANAGEAVTTSLTHITPPVAAAASDGTTVAIATTGADGAAKAATVFPERIVTMRFVFTVARKPEESGSAS